mgnify:CR=1 FL=1
MWEFEGVFDVYSFYMIKTLSEIFDELKPQSVPLLGHIGILTFGQ